MMNRKKTNNQNRNYQKELEKIIGGIGEHPLEEEKPSLLLHACCAPCSSYVLEYLTRFFHITIFYYNPNVTPETEYVKRVQEMKRLIRESGLEQQVSFLEGNYDPERFFAMAKGMEQEPERGIRCYHCYRLRMEEAAIAAARLGADYFTTTLSISPHKNARWINEIGEQLEETYGVRHLPSDFKKRSGYLRSIALSEQYHLYRQNYCGCVFSKQAALKSSL
ncbi:MAG: epoxyqueuosine reductase QueH [Eubacteriales bacterium]|nr:epoxyqueuosine reductase QueH [Eubacteriales bacterium]